MLVNIGTYMIPTNNTLFFRYAKSYSLFGEKIEDNMLPHVSAIAKVSCCLVNLQKSKLKLPTETETETKAQTEE